MSKLTCLEASADAIAQPLQAEYYRNDATKLKFLRNRLGLLKAVSSLWTSVSVLTPEVRAAIMKHIRSAPLDEQKGLVFLAQHILHCSTNKGYLPWYNRTSADDSGFWNDRGIHHHPLVWMFRFDTKELLNSDRFQIEIKPNRQHKTDVIAMLKVAEKQWQSVHGKDWFWQKTSLENFVTDLKSWAKTVDCSDQPLVNMDYIITLNRCAQYSADRHAGGNTDTRKRLVYGFEVLDKLSSIWCRHDTDTAQMCHALTTYIRSMPAPNQEAIRFLFRTISGTGTTSWVAPDEQAVQTKRYQVSGML